MIPVVLTSSEVDLATTIGFEGHAEALRMGLPDAHGATGQASIHVLGASGELAAYKALGQPWQPTINTFKAPGGDGGAYEVRTRSKHSWDLLVRPGDPDGRHVIHVTASSTGHQVHGWLYTSEAKQSQWLHGHGGRPPAYFVPSSALRPLSTLTTAPHLDSPASS